MMQDLAMERGLLHLAREDKLLGRQYSERAGVVSRCARDGRRQGLQQAWDISKILILYTERRSWGANSQSAAIRAIRGPKSALLEPTRKRKIPETIIWLKTLGNRRGIID